MAFGAFCKKGEGGAICHAKPPEKYNRKWGEHAEVAANWTKQTNDCWQGKRMFYEGALLYSHGYHYVLGRIVTRLDGTRYAIINCDPWKDARNRPSVSTGDHRRLAEYACEARGLQVAYSEAPQNDLSLTDYQLYLNNAEELLKRAQRARRSIYKGYAIEAAELAIAHAEDINRLGALGVPVAYGDVFEKIAVQRAIVAFTRGHDDT